jgi:hypothetical protein
VRGFGSAEKRVSIDQTVFRNEGGKKRRVVEVTKDDGAIVSVDERGEKIENRTVSKLFRTARGKIYKSETSRNRTRGDRDRSKLRVGEL